MDLGESTARADVAIVLTDSEGESYVHDYLPIIMSSQVCTGRRRK
jgi:hypothetical protein